MSKYLALALAAAMGLSSVTAGAATLTRKTLIAAVGLAGNLYPGGDALGSQHLPTGQYVIAFPNFRGANPFCAVQTTLFLNQGALLSQGNAAIDAVAHQILVYVNITDTAGNPNLPVST